MLDETPIIVDPAAPPEHWNTQPHERTVVRLYPVYLAAWTRDRV